MNCLPVYYEFQSNAWMTEQIFTKWFNEVFVPSVTNYLSTKGLEEKAFLILDNCAAHPDDLSSENGKIKCLFLPPNTTALIQPMDQSPIAALKKSYKQHSFEKWSL